METPALRRRRREAVWTQAELANRAGVTQATVVRAEAGKPIRISTVRKLADALGIAPSELVAKGAEQEDRDDR